QAGIHNVVAPLGTSLTSDQIRLLKRFSDEFLVLFDGDRAGIAAAARAFAVFGEVGIFADAAFLPEGHDPDTYVRREGAAAMEGILGPASPLVDHYLRSLAAPDGSLGARARAAQTVAELCERLENPIFTGLLRRRAAEYLGLPEDQLRGRVGPRRDSGPTPPARAGRPVQPPPPSPPGHRILRLLLVHRALPRLLPPPSRVHLRSSAT